MKKVSKPILIVKICFLVQSPASRILKLHCLQLSLLSEICAAPGPEKLSKGPDRS